MTEIQLAVQFKQYCADFNAHPWLVLAAVFVALVYI